MPSALCPLRFTLISGKSLVSTLQLLATCHIFTPQIKGSNCSTYYLAGNIGVEIIWQLAKLIVCCQILFRQHLANTCIKNFRRLQLLKYTMFLNRIGPLHKFLRSKFWFYRIDHIELSLASQMGIYLLPAVQNSDRHITTHLWLIKLHFSWYYAFYAALHA